MVAGADRDDPRALEGHLWLSPDPCRTPGSGDTVNELEAAGIIVTEQLDYLLPDDDDVATEAESEEDSDAGRGRKVTSYRYSLSQDPGMRIGQDLWASLSKDEQKALTEFKQFFASISLRQLLIFTYEKFPSYTSRSTIKRQLGFK